MQEKKMAEEQASKQKKGVSARGSREIKEREYFFYLLIITFAVLMAPHLIRFVHGNTSLIGNQAYLHQRVSESINFSSPNILGMLVGGKFEDSLVLGGRSVDYTPYHHILASAGHLLTLDSASRLLPFIFGILTITFFYFVLKRLGVKSLNRLVLSLLLVLSPPFMYLFTISSPDSMAVFLTVLGAYLYLSDKKYSLAGSLLCFLLVSFFSLFNILLSVLALIIASFIAGEKKEKLMLFISCLLAIYLVKPVNFYSSFEYSEIALRELSSDLGALAGFGIFNMILAAIGLFYSWKRKERFYPLYFGILLLSAAAFVIGNETNVYSNFLLMVFAGIGLLRINELEWRFPQLRDITLMIIVCGLLFSSISYTMRLSDAMPNEDVIGSLGWLRDNAGDKGVVLSHYSNGYWIESVARKPALIDSFFYSIPGFDEKYMDSYDLFKSSSLDDAKALLDKYGISYIWITSEMKEGLVWGSEKEGLLFLLRNNETFKRVYYTNNTEIWGVLKH